MAPRVYLDTNVFIRAFEGADELARSLADLLAVDTRGTEPHFGTSELTLAEVLVHPYRHGDEALSRLYEGAVRPSAWLQVGQVERSVLTGAALLRSSYSLKLPDAIHVATALHMGCETLLTGDRGLVGPYAASQLWSGRGVQIANLTETVVRSLATSLRA